MHFKTFDFVKNNDGTSLKIRCRNCDAGIIDYYQNPDQKLYIAKGYQNKVNDCRSDINIRCNTCMNSESVEAYDILFVGQ